MRQETGKEQGVQVPHSEGTAYPTGPEPCVPHREAWDEALAGERAGQPLSYVTFVVRGADALPAAEGHTVRCVSASTPPAPRRLRPWRARHAPCTGTGRSHGWPLDIGRPALGRPEDRNR